MPGFGLFFLYCAENWSKSAIMLMHKNTQSKVFVSFLQSITYSGEKKI